MTNRMVKVKFEHGPELQVESGISLSQILAKHPAAREGLDFQPLGGAGEQRVRLGGIPDRDG